MKRKYSYPYYHTMLSLGVLVTLTAINVFDIIPDLVNTEFQKKSI